MRYTAEVTETELTEKATARARDLMAVINQHGGVELTARERDVVMLGVQLGVSACVAAIRAMAVEQ
jgi:hypothetical protein